MEAVKRTNTISFDIESTNVQETYADLPLNF
jgi:hypothetical protein